jgi:type IV fimbrial biogenesis protein FimT
MNNAHKRSHAVTLLELMATISIAGTLLAIAIPSFMGVITNNRTTSIANQLVSAIAYARTEAIKRGTPVAIRHKGETASVWDDGWDIFTDANGDGTMNMADELLKTYEALPDSHTLRTGISYAYWMAYKADGNSDGAKLGHDTFRLCDSSSDTNKSRSIIFNKTGRVRIKVGTPKWLDKRLVKDLHYWN